MSERVMASLQAEFPSVSVQDILDGWTLDEVAYLLHNDAEALDELASATFSKLEPDEIYISINRAEVESYLAARRKEPS